MAEVSESYGYLDESGNYIVIGEVRNTGDVPLHFIEVVVTFFDQAKEELQRLSVSTTLEVARPGQVSPFLVILRDVTDAPLVKSFDAKIGNLLPTESKEAKLVVIFHKIETFEDSVQISGRMVNDGTAKSSNTKATIVLYNIVGEPVRYASVFTDPKDILGFASATFSATIKVDNVADIVGYAITLESTQYSETSRVVQKSDTGLRRINEIVALSNLVTLDQTDRPAAIVRVNDPVLIKLNVTNKVNERRDFTYIVKITDQEGFVTSLSWLSGTLGPRQSDAPALAWASSEPGAFLIEVFVWESIERAIPMSFRTVSTNIQVR
jgi:hypothetical protein